MSTESDKIQRNDSTEHLLRIDDSLQDNIEKLRTIFAILPVGVALFDDRLQIIVSNPALETIMGTGPEGLRDGTYKQWKYFRADGTAMPRDEFPGSLAVKEQRIIKGVVIGVEKEDGSLVWTEACAAPLNLPDISCVLVTRDITERKHDIEALRHSEQKFRGLSNQLEAILDHLPGLIFYKDKKNNFIRVNKYVADAYKKEKKELEGVNLRDLHSKEEADTYYQDDLAVLNSGVAKLNIEEQWETADGLRWVNTSKIPFIDENGGVVGVIGISMDITERKCSDRLIQELVHRLELEKNYAQKSALTDGLTGIANRWHFDDTLKREFFRLKRSRAPLSLIMLDIDHFKRFNDHYGHLAGDDCLRRIATALRTAVGRAPDFVARYGGEEFVVILPDTSTNGAITVAERLRRAVEALAIPHEDSGTTTHVTISLGLTIVHPNKIESPEKIVEMADEALYRAKGNGRNRIEVISDVSESTPPEDEKSGFIKLVWHTSDECGNAIIDEQHKNLFKASNKLLSAIIRGCPHDECTVLITGLLDKTMKHFQEEEEILVSKEYPLTEKHRHAHVKLVSKATELIEKYKNKDLPMNELFDFLAFDLVAQHLFIEDKKFFPYI